MITKAIQEKEVGYTLGKWLRCHFPLSHPQLAQFIRKKLIKINGGKADLGTVLRLHDLVTVYVDIPQQHEKQCDLSEIRSSVVFENDDFVVIEKPVGVSAQGQDDSIAAHTNLYIVHRLDKTTSGLMVCAKNKNTAAKFSVLFREGAIKKTYHALCEYSGRAAPTGIIRDFVDGKEACTHYEVLEVKNQMALVEFIPKTGRKHQIRIHAAKQNMPILGDTIYGGPKARRIWLHSKELEIPYENEVLHFKSDYNMELK